VETSNLIPLPSRSDPFKDSIAAVAASCELKSAYPKPLCLFGFSLSMMSLESTNPSAPSKNALKESEVVSYDKFPQKTEMFSPDA